MGDYDGGGGISVTLAAGKRKSLSFSCIKQWKAVSCTCNVPVQGWRPEGGFLPYVDLGTQVLFILLLSYPPRLQSPQSAEGKESGESAPLPESPGLDLTHGIPAHIMLIRTSHVPTLGDKEGASPMTYGWELPSRANFPLLKEVHACFADS